MYSLVIVGSVSELIALAGASYPVVDTTGYWAARDGGHARYIADYGDTTTVQNGVTVFVASDGTRYKLQYRDEIHARQAGAKWDGATDDYAAITSAIAALTMERGGGCVRLPVGTGITSQQITHATFVTLRGEGQGATVLMAKAGTNFQYVVYGAQGNQGQRVIDMTIDANGPNRAAVQTMPYYGVELFGGAYSLVERVTVQHTLGYNGASAVGIQLGGLSQYGRISYCIAQNCGATGQASDGFFTSGYQNLIGHSVANNCFDTGFVIESSSQSGTVGCSAVNCGAVAAITNASANMASGNFIDGLTGTGWNSSVTGGILLGNPSASTTGTLSDTRLSGVTLVGGNGPAIVIAKAGSAVTQGVLIEGCMVDGNNAQALVATVQDLQISSSRFTQNSPAEAVIELLSGSNGFQMNGSIVKGAYSFGVQTYSVPNVYIDDNTIIGDGVHSAWGFYAFGSASNVNVRLNKITGMTTGLAGSDAGTTITTT